MMYSFFNFKKAFIIFLAFKLFLVQDITVVSVPGIPLLTLDLLINVFFIIRYTFIRKKVNNAKLSFPYSTPLLGLCFAWIVSSLFAVAGFGAEVSALLGNIINEILVLVMIWNIIETKDDFNYLFILITMVVLVSCIYGFIEYRLQFNPLSEYEHLLNNDPSRMLIFNYGTEGPRGYHVNSIFEHPIGASMTWALYCAFVFMIAISYNEKLPLCFIAFVTAALCIPSIIITKQRAGLVFLIILSLSFIKIKKKKTYLLLIPAFFSIFLFYEQISNNVNLFLSIFDSNAQIEVSGSSVSMRIEQLLASIDIMSRSPIWGLGSKYRNIIFDYTISLLRGVESIWFFVLPCYGLIGIVSYFYYFYWSVYKIPRFFHSYNLFLYTLAYWLIYSVTSLPGFRTYMLFLVLTYIIKKTSRYQRITNKIKTEWTFKNNVIIYRNVFKNYKQTLEWPNNSKI